MLPNLTSSQIVVQLRTTYLATNNAQRKQAEDNLVQFEQHPSFLSLICELLQQQSIEDQVKHSAAVYVNKYAKNVFSRNIQSEINSSSENILRMLDTPIKIQYKMHVISSLHYLLTRDKQNIIRKAFENNLFLELGHTSKINFDTRKFEFLSLYGHLMMSTASEGQSLLGLIEKTYEPFIEISLKMLEYVEKQIQIKSDTLLESLLILKSYSHLFKIMFKRMNFLKYNELFKYLYNQRLQILVSRCLRLTMPDNPIKDCIIMSINHTVCALINTIKQFHIFILTVVFKTLLGQSLDIVYLQVNVFYSNIYNYLNLMIVSATNLLKTEFENLPQEALRVLEAIVKIVTMLVQYQGLYEFFFNARRLILQEMVYPLISFRYKDLNNYHEQPQEFIHYLNGILGKKDMQMKTEEDDNNEEDDTVQALAAKLLIAYCRYQDGCLADIIANCFGELKNSKQYQHSQKQLLILCIVAYRTAQREQIHTAMRIYLESQIPQLFNEVTDVNAKIERALKVQLLLRYNPYLDQLDETFSTKFTLQVCLRILGGMIKPRDGVVQMIALELLSNMFSLSSLSIYERSGEILNILNKLIMMDKVSLTLYDTILELIKDNSDKIATYPQNVIDCITILTNQINSETLIKSSSQIIVNKCWNIIRQVGESPSFNKLIPSIEEAVSPLFAYMSNPMQIEYQEDIVLLVSAFIKGRKTISPIELALFEQFPKLFQKYKYTFAHLFEAINLYLYYGGNLIGGSVPAIKVVLQLSFKAMFVQSNSKENINEANNCEGVLILQNLILSCGNSIPAQLWPSIIENLYKRINSIPIKKLFLKSNIDATLALALLNSYSSTENTTQAQCIWNSILNSIGNFFHPHPTKVYIITMTEFLKHFNSNAIKLRYSRILDCIITMLRVEFIRKQNNIDVNQEQKDVEENDHAMSMQTFRSRISTIDQYQNFKSTLEELKKSNLDLLQKSVNQLPKQKKEFLKTIVQMKKVENSHRPIIHVKRTI